MVKIIYQQVTEEGKFILGFEGLSSETKPTGDLIADGSSFKETNTDAIYILDTTWKLAKAGQLKELPSVSAGDNGKIMKVADGAWGLGNDSGLPADFPAEGIANANKFLGFDASGDYAALTAPSGGGAEKFVVTLTADDSGAETVWTADKALADIVAAKADGDTVVCAYTDSVLGVTFELSCVAAENLGSEEEPYYICAFGGTVMSATGSSSVTVAGTTDESDAWLVNSTPNGSELPTYSSSNNGQVLGVSSGSPAWVDSNAPLIVTLTQDQTDTDTYNGDKTFAEVYEAYIAGRKVLYSLTIGTVTTHGDVIRAYRDTNEPSEEYDLTIHLNGELVDGSGAANDYVSFTEK